MTSSDSFIVTIDGPSGAGKSSISRRLAEQFSLTYIDTGAMFRAVALAANREGVDWSDEAGLVSLLERVSITFVRVGDVDHVTIDGEDVEGLIRDPLVSRGASQVAGHPGVRTHLLALQREMGRAGRVILEGRDTGSVVFPNATIKIYLDASARERARRRLAQLGPESGQDLDSLQEAIEARDRADSQRETAPLVCPQGAHRLDATSLSFEEVISKLSSLIASQLNEPTPTLS